MGTCRRPQETGKDQETDSTRELPEGTQICRILDVSLVDPRRTSFGAIRNRFVLATERVITCYGGN